MMRHARVILGPSLLALGLAFGLVAATVGTAWADDLVEIDRVVVEFDAFGRMPAHHPDLYVRISTDVGVPVVVLKERHVRWHLSWGELYMIHLLVWHSGRPFDVILADHRAGRGWGVIAQAHGVKLGKLVSAAHKSEKAWKDQKAKAGSSDKSKGGSADKAGGGSSAKAKDDAGPKGATHSGGGKGSGGGGKGKK